MKALLIALALISVSFAVYNDNTVHAQPVIDVENRYIYVFRENIPADQKAGLLSIFRSFEGDVAIQVEKEFQIGSFHAFVGVSNPESASMVAKHPFIKYFVPDGIAKIQSTTMACQSVSAPSWGLTRVSYRERRNDETYSYELDGQGVTSYIVDTGIYVDHVDFEGRATWGATFTGDNNDKDCNGHGTHVAGTVAGKSYGIAKKASLVAVKVLNCYGSGSWSGVIGGLEWVANQHKSKGGPSTANMSLGGGKNQAVDDAVIACVKAGVSVAVAAGNDRGDACRTSPAGAEPAITVGATAVDDVRSSFSAVGTCVDVFAPGTGITSAWIGGPNDIKTISGTSMASPHVCGVATQILGANRSLSPAEVKSRIVSSATPNKIDLDCSSGVHSSCSQSPNKLLHSGC